MTTKIYSIFILILTVFSAVRATNIGLEQYWKAITKFSNSDLRERGVQLPMGPGPVRPPGSEPDDHHVGSGDGGLTLSDILPKTRSINIFASLTRDISSVSDRLDSIGQNTTLLAPLNSAMQDLSRKPWEDRPGDNSPVRAANDEDKAAQNLRQFVEEHIIPISPWKSGKDNKVQTIGGQELWWEERNGKRVILPGELVVDSIVGTVGNGEVWAVKGVVNFA